MAKKDFDDSDGVWRTVGGRRIFIKNGQDLASAMVESGKFKNLRSSYKKQKEKLTDSDEDKEIKGRMKELQREIDSGRNNKEKTERLKDELQQYKDKYEDDDEYALYKKAKENPDSIDPMTENSTDWEALDEKYRDRYDREFKASMGEVDIPDNFEAQFNDYAKEQEEKERLDSYKKAEDLHASYAQYLHDKMGMSWESVTALEENKSGFEKSMKNWEKSDAYKKYEKESKNEAVNRYQDRIKELKSELKGDISASERKEKEEQIDRLSKDIKSMQPEKQSANDIMNKAIREKASKKSTFKEDLPKKTEIKEQGTSNRKEVSENIQAHILEYYTPDYTGEDNVSASEAFMRQMEAMGESNMWNAGKRIAEGGSYLIYNGDMADFLNELKINPKGKTFSEDKAFDMYTSLVGRESAKLYERLQKNAYQKYKQEHPLSNMSFEDYKNMRKK